MNPSLETRFLRHLDSLGLLQPDVHLLVAVSGGCDSVVLLHLFRFRAPDLRLTAAHLDHAMREGSAGDACWVAGLCRAWSIPLLYERAAPGLRSEADARRARYRFLRHAARTADATHIATAHQADDQAETVLFRVLRGTGLAGLRGITPAHPSGLVRPLLPFWRREIEAYARRNDLRWREDPTNRSLAPARNRIRHEILPRIERTVAPGARRSLVRLADAARESERVREALVAPLERALVRREGDDLILARRELRDYDPALGPVLLRNLLRRFGTVLDRAGTRTALQFISGAPSGRQLQLPGGIRISTEFDSARIARAREIPPDEPLPIHAAPDGSEPAFGTVRLAGRRYRVSWRVAPGEEELGAAASHERWRTGLRVEALAFPLLLRSWEPGDRIRTPGGTKRLKKLFVERRIPHTLRSTIPVLADRTGAILWVAGVQCAKGVGARSGDDTFFVAITE